MKKIVFLIVSLAILNSQALACLCNAQVVKAFNSLEKDITKSVGEQQAAVRELAEKVRQSQVALEDESNAIKKLVATEKQLALSRGNLLFELNKKIKFMK